MRRSKDYASHIDPLYCHFTKYRTMKTKAKMLEKLRRRGRFEWDAEQKPFFSSRHVRQASFYNGKPPGGRWQRVYEEDGKLKDADEPANEDGYELSQREKEWKQQMEVMRKRIQQDPYEAIFGQRFEPFWGPLVPTWLRKEMGLQDWPIAKNTWNKTTSETSPGYAPNTSKINPKSGVMGEMSDNKDKRQTDEPKGTPKAYQNSPVAEIKPALESSPAPATYSSFSSTSWDSWTKRSRRTEWDSASGQTKRWEYDPISNRMVQIAGPKRPEPVETKNVGTLKSEVPAKKETEEHAPTQSQDFAKRAHDMQSLINTPLRELEKKAQEVQSEALSDVRKAIPIPPQPAHMEAMASPTIIPSSDRSTQARPSAPRPAALARLPKDDLDFLTADTVRAKMGKTKQPSSSTKPTSPAEKAAMEAAFDKNVNSTEAEDAAVLSPSDFLQAKEQLTSFLQRRNALKERQASESTPRQSDRQTSNTYTAVERPTSIPLVSAVERMQSRDLPTLVEADDAAAHESTEPVEHSNVPKDWSKQADLLQADRVKRTTSKHPFPQTRWLDDMQARKAAWEAANAESATEQAAAAEKNAKLEKLNALFEAEVKEQKSLMQSYENRYAHKIRNLRQEVEAAYKQSALHSEMHVERVKSLQTELEKAQTASGDSAALDKKIMKEQPDPVAVMQGEGDFCTNVAKYASSSKSSKQPDPVAVVQGEGDFCSNVAKYASSDKWYKQPAVPLPLKQTKHEMEKAEQTARDQALVKEVREIYEKEYGVIDALHRQKSAAKKLVTELDKLKSAQAVGVESNAELGEALAKHEKGERYRFQSDDLEAELKQSEDKSRKGRMEAEVAAQEEKAHEALVPPEAPAKMRQIIAEQLLSDVHGRAATLKQENRSEVEKALRTSAPTADSAPKLSTEVEKSAANTQSNSTPLSSVPWEEPPVYKMLTYDPGNDTFSTITTTSNFTGNETPISVQQAFSQLYRPARFASAFAALQEDGYQVIHGTSNLLVFRKVQSPRVPSSDQPASVEHVDASLVDHGLLTPKENALAQEAANFYDKYQAKPRSHDLTLSGMGKVNPIDGTTKAAEGSVSTGNFASPTGFVNYDPIDPSSVSASPTKAPKTPKPQTLLNHTTGDIDFDEMMEDADLLENQGTARSNRYNKDMHSRRVRREEPVFSGTRRGHRSWQKRYERYLDELEQARGSREKTKRRRGGALKWALGAGLGAAGVAYTIGVAAEAARQTRVEKERWEQIIQGKRGRWE